MEFLNEKIQDFFLAKKLRAVPTLSSDDSLSYGSEDLVGKAGRGQAIGGGGDMVDAGPACAGIHTQAFIQCPDRGWIFLKKNRLQHTHGSWKNSPNLGPFLIRACFFFIYWTNQKNEFGVV